MYTHTCVLYLLLAPDLVADKWGQHPWGRCKSKNILTGWGKRYTLALLWEDTSRLMGLPQNPSVEKHEVCSDPIINADPVCPFLNPAPLAIRGYVYTYIYI